MTKNKLTKSPAPSNAIDKPVTSMLEILAADGSDIKTGDIYYHESYHCDFWKVQGFQVAENYRLPTVEVTLVGVDNEGKRVNDHITVTHRELQSDSKYILLDIPAGKTVKEVIAEATEEGFAALRDPSKYLALLESLEKSETTSIISVDQKSMFETTQTLLDQQQRRVRLVQELMRSKVATLGHIASRLQEQITKIQRIVGVIELYLGVYEEILQIQEGEPAPIDEPISIRQLVLYMDEETGIYEGGGIDWRNIEEFDAWLLRDNHLDIVLPEQKGMVVICPSRQNKYHGDAIYNAQMQAKNKMSYLLIRNGNKVYRIYTDIVMTERFFPTIEEAAKIEILFEESSNKGHFSFEARDGENARFLYLRNTFLIQGLIDRSQLFEPLRSRIDFFNPETYAENGPIRLIRDDELHLPSGRVSFHKWQAELNSHIERGSRIFISKWPEWMHDSGGSDHHSYAKHFTVYRNWYPDGPNPGLYIVEEILDRSDCNIRFLYHARWFGEDIPRRMSFLIYRSMSNLLNYDRVSLEDLNFYIYTRTERKNFLDMLPVLVEMRKERLKEIEDEKGFVHLMSQKVSVSEEKIWEAIDWWKNKNIWRRPIRQDDAKAWRMIYKRLGKESDYVPDASENE